MGAPRLRAVEDAPPARSEMRATLAERIEAHRQIKAQIAGLERADRWSFVEAAINALDDARNALPEAEALDQKARTEAVNNGEPIPMGVHVAAANQRIVDAERHLQDERSLCAAVDADLRMLIDSYDSSMAPGRVTAAVKAVIEDETSSAVDTLLDRFRQTAADLYSLYETLHVLDVNEIRTGEVSSTTLAESDFLDSLRGRCVIHREPALMEAGDGRGLAARS